ncbi:HAMP domain-containing protein [Desulfoluna spongiiphila]|uniref:histidine kinase n=1 Tax=Desulfoluna spongiiphila TaxID=419481 RepID=A0A1G5BLE7_9BACT|nr:HAMP domain-containing protein [Desulfoluna spongiiphila]SCX91022.1 MJ0042 family finger-like domain-containing protein [Desulfoluna spongiiphila]VVS93798.1 zinc finger/thioredoxin putative [Desulfoluna spongiiphila]
MNISCNHCGKTYSIEAHKLSADRSKARCLTCGEWFVIDRENESASPDAVHLTPEEYQVVSGDASSEPEPGTPPIPIAPPAPMQARISQEPTEVRPRRNSIGLTGKFILFSILPFLVVCAASLWYFTEQVMPRMDTQVTETMSDAIWSIEQRHLREQTRSNARQVRQYLFSHPDLINRNFNRDIYFKKIAIKKIGTSGYTFLYERPSPGGIWRSWAHVNPNIVGSDLSDLKPTQPDFDAFWKILTAVETKPSAEGFYEWQDKGQTSRWYMTVTKVRGTPYVTGTAFKAEEIEKSVTLLRQRSRRITTEALHGTLLAMGLGALLAASVFIFYGRRTTRRIIHLSDVADRISLGDLTIPVHVDAGDEIGELAEAISRMRDSISVAIKRLRGRNSM